MVILDVNKISKNYGYGTLFEDITFTLNEGESVAIVGPNGCGKSTILKIIAGIESKDTGTISIKKGANIAYLDQLDSITNDTRTNYEVIKDAFKELNNIEQEIKKYELKLNDDYNEKVLEKYCDLIEKYKNKGGYEIEANIKDVINGLYLDEDMLKQSYNSLSGGEKTIIRLAKILLMKPDLLLLDEPTNHLDIKRIEWLEDYIKKFKGALVIVSHDRYFLDKIASQILAIDDYGVGKIYSTNYSGYLIKRESEFQKDLAKYEDEQEEIKELEQKAKEFMNLGMNRNSSTLTRQGKVLWERAQRMREVAIKKPKEQKRLNISFNEDKKSSKKIIIAKNLSVIKSDGNIILNNINLEIFEKERVALLGENGTGKSTLIKTIMGNQSLQITGDIFVGPSVKIGYIPQIIEFENNIKLLDYFKKEALLPEEKCRSILARFKFNKEDVNKKVNNLSGGEKMKIKLALLLQLEVNTLILDEPTNHIDIPTKEVLEEALEEFNGTLIFISHDRYFINKFASKIIEFKNGEIKQYLGNYDDYKTSLKI